MQKNEDPKRDGFLRNNENLEVLSFKDARQHRATRIDQAILLKYDIYVR